MVQLPDITTLIGEVQALSARVDAWLDQADATVGGYAQLQTDLAALQAQVQQLAGSDGTVAAHTHQISEVQGLAAALAAKLDDAAGVVQQHHIADGAITATKIADGAITAQHLTGLAGGTGYQTLPGGIIIQWGNADSFRQQDTPVSFPVAFPAACDVLLAGAPKQEYVNLAFKNVSQTGFKVLATNGSGTIQFAWLAIGR